MNTITRLAISRICTKRTRSIVICTAIFLTMVLFMSVVSISVNMLDSVRLMLTLTSGFDYHGYLDSNAFTLSTEDLRDHIKQSEHIRDTVIAGQVGTLSLPDATSLSASPPLLAVSEVEALEHFFLTITEGSFPTGDNELLVNPDFFPDAQTGSTVLLRVLKPDEHSTTNISFTVSGLIRCGSDIQIPAVLADSEAISARYGLQEASQVYFLMDNTINLSGKYDSLLENLEKYRLPDKDSVGVLNPAHLEASPEKIFNISNLLLIVTSVLVVFLCSFLLIYNVYSIALIQDMQSLGLLNVIGTTHRQLKALILTESALLFLTVLPLGLTAGYFIGWKILSPLLFSTAASGANLSFTFSPWIILLTIALTLFTLFWSATRPLKKIRALSPMEAVDYTPSADIPKVYVRRKNYLRKNTTPTASRLAKYTISKNKRKTVVSALSISLSVMLLMLISTLCDYIMTYTSSHLRATDFCVIPQQIYRYSPTENAVLSDQAYTSSYAIDEGVGFSEDYLTSVKSLDGVKRIFRIRTTVASIPTPSQTTASLRALKDRVSSRSWSGVLQNALEGRMDIPVLGIPDELFTLLLDKNGEKISQDIQDGWVVSAGDVNGLSTEQNESIRFSYFKEGESVTLVQRQYEIFPSDGRAPYNLTGYLKALSDRPVFYLRESDFLAEFGEGLTYALLLDAKDGCYDSLRKDLEALPLTLTVDDDILDNYTDAYRDTFTLEKDIIGITLSLHGKYDNLNNMREIVFAIQSVGYSLTAMIFLIGGLNIVNTALTSVTERKREFAMLEAVGMTEKQMLGMLLRESLYSGGVSCMLTICGGIPLLYLITMTAMDALVPLDWLSGMAMLVICMGISVLSAVTVFRLTKSTAVTERIKTE